MVKTRSCRARWRDRRRPRGRGARRLRATTVAGYGYSGVIAMLRANHRARCGRRSSRGSWWVADSMSRAIAGRRNIAACDRRASLSRCWWRRRSRATVLAVDVTTPRSLCAARRIPWRDSFGVAHRWCSCPRGGGQSLGRRRDEMAADILKSGARPFWVAGGALHAVVSARGRVLCERAGVRNSALRGIMGSAPSRRGGTKAGVVERVLIARWWRRPRLLHAILTVPRP